MVKRPEQHVLEDESIEKFKAFLPREWIKREKPKDYGIDLEIEIVDDAQVTAKIIWVQMKACGALANGEAPSESFSISKLDYYLGCPVPVLIIRWVKETGAFYFQFAQEYITETIPKIRPGWRDQKETSVHFPPDSELSDPEILNQNYVDWGIYTYKLWHATHVPSDSPQLWLDGIPESPDELLKRLTLDAVTLMGQEKYQPAIEKFEETLRTCKTSETERMSINLNLGIAYYLRGNLEKGLTHYLEVVRLSNMTNDPNAIQGKAAAFGNIGIIYRIKGDLDKAMRHQQDALKINREIGYRQGVAAALGNIGPIYGAMGDLDGALQHLQEAMQIHREIGSRKGEAHHGSNIGIIYFYMGNLNEALRHHLDALDIYREMGYRKGVAMGLGNIGNVYLANGDLDEALKYHQEALEIDHELGYRQDEASDLGSIGTIYQAKGDLDEALKYHQNALEIHREVSHRQGEANELGNIGNLYKAKGNLGESLKRYQEALVIHCEVGYRQGEANDLGNIGLIYLTTRNFDEALKHLKDALSILDEYGLAQGRDVIVRAIDEIEGEMGNDG